MLRCANSRPPPLPSPNRRSLGRHRVAESAVAIEVSVLFLAPSLPPQFPWRIGVSTSFAIPPLTSIDSEHSYYHITRHLHFTPSPCEWKRKKLRGMFLLASAFCVVLPHKKCVLHGGRKMAPMITFPPSPAQGGAASTRHRCRPHLPYIWPPLRHPICSRTRMRGREKGREDGGRRNRGRSRQPGRRWRGEDGERPSASAD